MRLIFRNLSAIIAKFKVATLLNVLGLSTAFAAFLIILMQVSFEYSYENYHPEAKNIYRMETVFPDGYIGWAQSRGVIDFFFHSSPHIKAGSILNPYIGDVYFTVDNGGEKNGFKEDIYSCYPEITEIFNFTMIEGDSRCLQSPEKVLIPESMARKLFGTESAVDKPLYFNTNFLWTVARTNFFVVGGVYKDFPANTQIRNALYVGMDDSTKDDWMSNNYFGYVLLNEGVSGEEVANNFNHNFDYAETQHAGQGVSLRLTPIQSIYFSDSDEDAGLVKTGNKSATFLLILIAFLIIIIATINYVNFYISMAPMRIKSINTQKVMGGSDKAIRRVLVSEGIFISFLSFLLALGIVYFFKSVDYISFTEASLLLRDYKGLVLGTAILSVLIGCGSGLYPAYYITSFSPALVLKGGFSLSPTGTRFRTVLVCFQFVISFVLIISSLFVRDQNKFIQNYKLGFDTEQIAIVELDQELYFRQGQTYANRLKEYAGIEDVAFAVCKFGSDTYPNWSGDYRGENLNGFQVLAVSWNFPKMMGIELLDGELNEEQERTSTLYLLPNEKMKEEFNMESNSTIDNLRGPGYREEVRIAGFTDNINFESLHSPVTKACLAINDWRPRPYSYIKIIPGTDIHEAVNHITKTLQEIDSTYPFDIEFYDTVFNTLYHKERNMNKIIFLFSLLAILISTVGVFGLIIFETHYRMKEIGLRKVHGATIGSILWNFNKHYTYIVIGCFIFACPIAWYGVSEWLKSFAYKTPMNWWIYLISFVFVLGITLLTVSFQSWKAAYRNPVDSLKIE